MSASWELQKAIYTRLSTGSSYTVYDEVPSGAAYPYRVIGDDTEIDDSTDSNIGSEATVTIHTWSIVAGFSEIKAMADDIYSLLNRYDLPISGVNTVGVTREYSRPIRDPDGITRHGVQRFRVNYDNS